MHLIPCYRIGGFAQEAGVGTRFARGQVEVKTAACRVGVLHDGARSNGLFVAAAGCTSVDDTRTVNCDRSVQNCERMGQRRVNCEGRVAAIGRPDPIGHTDEPVTRICRRARDIGTFAHERALSGRRRSSAVVEDGWKKDLGEPFSGRLCGVGLLRERFDLGDRDQDSAEAKNKADYEYDTRGDMGPVRGGHTAISSMIPNGSGGRQFRLGRNNCPFARRIDGTFCRIRTRCRNLLSFLPEHRSLVKRQVAPPVLQHIRNDGGSRCAQSST